MSFFLVKQNCFQGVSRAMKPQDILSKKASVFKFHIINFLSSDAEHKLVSSGEKAKCVGACS